MLRIELSDFGIKINALSMVLTETLNEISVAKLKIIIDKKKSDYCLLQQKIKITIQVKSKQKIWLGSIVSVKRLGFFDREKLILLIVAKDNLYKMHQGQHSRTFVSQSIHEIMNTINQHYRYLTEFNFCHKMKDYTVQFQETDFAFINRFLSSNHLFFYLNQQQKWVLNENVNSWKSIHVSEDQITDFIYIQNEKMNLYKLSLYDVVINLSEKIEINNVLYPYRITYHMNNESEKMYSGFNESDDVCECKVMATDQLESLDCLMNSHAEFYYQKPVMSGVFFGEVLRVDKSTAKLWFEWDENNPDKKINACPDVFLFASQSANEKYCHFPSKKGDCVLVQYLMNDAQRVQIIGASCKNTIESSETSNFIRVAEQGMTNEIEIEDKDNQEQIVLKSTDAILISSEDSLLNQSDSFTSETDNLTISNTENSIIFNAKNNILIQAGDSSICITPHSISIKAASIVLNAGESSLTGGIAVKGVEHTCPKVEAGVAHRRGPVIEASNNVFINGKAILRVGDKLQCYNSTDKVAKGHSNIYVNNRSVALGSSPTQHGGKIKMNDSSVQTQSNSSLSSQKSWLDLDLPYFIVTVQLQDLDNHHIEDARLILVSHQDKKIFSEAIHIETGEAIYIGLKSALYDCYLESETSQAYEIVAKNNERQLPYYKVELTINGTGTKDSPEKVTITVLPSLMVLNYRFKTQQPVFPLEWVDYFKNKNNSVTIFIHGFNVPVGQLDNAIAGIAENNNTDLDEIFLPISLVVDMEKTLTKQAKPLLKANVLATVYRDKKIVSQQIHEDVSDMEWNGTGALNWFLHVEDNLFRALGFNRYDKNAYQHYQRCLHISWSGDPILPIDYMAAVPNAFAAGEKLAAVILFLKKQGLKIKVIAHSLGSAVLFGAMSNLSKTSAGAIDHAFFWEPAIPCNVFNRPEPKINQSDIWYHPWAIKGAKK